ncbi:MAG: hypothetical protein Q9182_001411, partial [Xanthomendoza sp. 2 TL-2023]
MAEVSSTRLYLGNLPRDVTKEDIQNHFKDAAGTIAEVKLMNGFGFIEYEDAMDARDVVPSNLPSLVALVNAMTSPVPRSALILVHAAQPIACRLLAFLGRPAGRLAPFRYVPLVLDYLDPGVPSFWSISETLVCVWLPSPMPHGTDLKDFARRSGLDVVYSEVGRDRDGKGFVEFETAADLKVAVDKLDNNEFKGATPQDEIPRNDSRYGRSRSPPPGRRPYPPDNGYYDRRPPPRDYAPRARDEYRRRSPPPRHYDEYSRHDRGYRSPPPVRPGRGPPIDERYPPARGGYDRDPYAAPPPRGPYDDPYAANGYGRPRERSPPPRGYGGYDDRPRY